MDAAMTVAVASHCAICGEKALRKYIGVVACPPCRTFFKRNAHIDQARFKCDLDGRCDVNTTNRHTCRSCRLKKCFASGMRSERLRGSLPKTVGKRTSKPSAHASQEPIDTLSLLQSDRSTLNGEQWTLLSNLLHCYDEHSGFAAAKRFVHEQSVLPIGRRFKTAAVSECSSSVMAGARLLFEKNADFLSLGARDRSLLLRDKFKYIGGLGGCFILHSTGLFDNPAFYITAEMLFGATAMAASKRTGEQLDSDIVVVKLVLAMLLFSTFDYTVYMNVAATPLDDVNAVLRIQDAYVELTWRYLLHKYDHPRAVMCFSNLIRCIFMINHAAADAVTREQYTTMVNVLIQQTEQSFSLSE